MAGSGPSYARIQIHDIENIREKVQDTGFGEEAEEAEGKSGSGVMDGVKKWIGG